MGRAITGSGLEALLYRLPDLQLTIPADDLSWTSSTWSRHLDALPVRFTPRPTDRTAPDTSHSTTTVADALTHRPAPEAVPLSAPDTAATAARVPRPRQKSPSAWKAALGRLVRR
jgi:hypothetical protein